MSYHQPDSVRELIERQQGVISRQQAIECGVSADAVDRRLRSGRWQQLQRGVYATFTGEPARLAWLWAAVLYGGPGAALSHQSAAEVFQLSDLRSGAIHLTIPESRRRAPVPGIVIHRSGRLADSVHPVLLPARIRIEDTVLDLAQQATTLDDAFGAACAACQRGLTTVSLLRAAMAKRKKQRWRRDLTQAFGDIAAGAHSLLEYRYVRLVETPHGLPKAERQARLAAAGSNRYLDNLYRDFGLLVELDGQQAHPEHQRWHDLRRINAITSRGVTTLRYGWTDVVSRPCRTATEISAVLRSLGWRGRLRQCNPDCRIP